MWNLSSMVCRVPFSKMAQQWSVLKNIVSVPWFTFVIFTVYVFKSGFRMSVDICHYSRMRFNHTSHRTCYLHFLSCLKCYIILLVYLAGLYGWGPSRLSVVLGDQNSGFDDLYCRVWWGIYCYRATNTFPYFSIPSTKTGQIFNF